MARVGNLIKIEEVCAMAMKRTQVKLANLS